MKVEDEGISLKGKSFATLKDSLLSQQAEESLRVVQLNMPQHKNCNVINNAKYSIITFIPMVLYRQFQHFFNLYFLCLTITQFVPALKVGFMINYVGPLSLVVMLSVLKEAYDDIQRHRRDLQINNQLYQISTPDGLMNKKSGNLAVGMVVQVNQNERIPADLLILKACDKDGNVFIRTDQLDGETDWKLRKAVKLTQNMELEELDGQAQIEQPHENIYQFKGVYQYDNIKESLSLENVVWANTVLATGELYGLVIYNGSETRMAMNSKVHSLKRGVFDLEVDYLSKLLFLIMLILTTIITFFSSPPLDFRYVGQTFIRYLVLVSNMIPISMRVNLEFAKLIYSIRINKDSKIEGTIARNSNIPEALGRIAYLLSDKTGTLTQNEMIFKRLSMEMRSYSHEQVQGIRQTVIEQLRINKFPCTSKSKDARLRDLVTCLAVCHNVTPIDDEDGFRTYQASSPDEVALVKLAEQLGFMIDSRDENQIAIITPIGREKYEVLQCFPFRSETKRMGILVDNGDKVIFYLKGADIIMRQFLPELQRVFIDEECENMAREGLRTLVMCQREISRAFYCGWQERYEEAKQLMVNREEAVEQVIGELEREMEFIGVTGVEDKLQEEVAQTIENMRNAGINVWMLTGDKMETAICIAILSGLKHPTQNFIIMKEIADEIQMQMLLNNFDASANNILVIDGASLTTALQYFEEDFIKAAQRCPSVVCCRCSPIQKSQIAELLRKYTKQVVACIGDGGNDVGMIQAADVGIGIEGKEGKQAALASDYSISKFKSLNILLLWHGRLSYKRNALLAQFIVHRGLLIAAVQAIFMFIFYFLSISLFSGLLMLGYSTVFTMFPVFCIIYDEDVKLEIALQFPALYKSLQQGRFLNGKTFLVWLWKATYQGFIIMICALSFIESAFLKIETTVFTCMIFTQYAMTLTELESLHIVMIIANVLSVLVYLGVLFMFPQHLIISDLNWSFFGWVLLIMLISWAPLYIAKRILKIVEPSDSEKLMKNVKREAINTNY